MIAVLVCFNEYTDDDDADVTAAGRSDANIWYTQLILSLQVCVHSLFQTSNALLPFSTVKMCKICSELRI